MIVLAFFMKPIHQIFIKIWLLTELQYKNGRMGLNYEFVWLGQKLISFISQSKSYFSFKLAMSVLSQKLQEATRLFQSHSFKQSLQAYEDCINFCRKTDESESMVFNIQSAKATLQYILGDYDTALTTLNSILKKDPYHFLSLLRRSQVYKKKNKLKRAQKDLDTIFVFCPDNLQISAFKVEIQHLIMKQEKEHEVTSESELSEEEEEELELNFSNLKQIDRKSIDKSCMKERKSRVTILGDTTFQYKIDDDAAETKQNEDFVDKAIRTYKQIELDDDDEDEQYVPIIHIKAPRRGKSILKNKGTTSIFIQAEDVQSRRSRYLGRQSKLLTLIKNIDGKMIPSAEHEHSENPSIKEVEFRKSTASDQPAMLIVVGKQNQLSGSRQRKSCLKRPSLDIPDVKLTPMRRSKFDSIDSSKIDGHLITNPRRKSIENNSLAISQGQVDPVKQDSDSDNDGSEHNIFGSKQFVLSQDLKQKLGLTDEPSAASHEGPKLKTKKSILKRKSSLINLMQLKKISYQEPEQMGTSNITLKSKKSVMFNCTL